MPLFTRELASRKDTWSRRGSVVATAATWHCSRARVVSRKSRRPQSPSRQPAEPVHARGWIAQMEESARDHALADVLLFTRDWVSRNSSFKPGGMTHQIGLLFTRDAIIAQINGRIPIPRCDRRLYYSRATAMSRNSRRKVQVLLSHTNYCSRAAVASRKARSATSIAIGVSSVYSRATVTSRKSRNRRSRGRALPCDAVHARSLHRANRAALREPRRHSCLLSTRDGYIAQIERSRRTNCISARTPVHAR